ncbi:hypothetical protein [Tenacibaculum dicentrarchi]|uniref:DUF3108 domain-containing protein n=1 Tax=Tenacibaculum dicentrarchi TaxID=669041 RepID=A0ABM9NXQ4_9FLAO
MKYKFLIIFLIFNLNINSQIKGKYSYGNSYDYRSILFKKDFTFEYFSGGCVSESYGKGNYKITNKKLYLKFEDQSTEFNSKYYSSSHKIINTIATSRKDSINIKIKVLDEIENPFFYSYLSNRRNHLGTSDLTGEIKSLSGSNKIKIPFSKSNYFLRVTAIGQESYPLIIIPDKNYEIEIILKDHPERKEIIQGVVFSYDIIKMKRKELELKTGNSSFIYKKN